MPFPSFWAHFLVRVPSRTAQEAGPGHASSRMNWPPEKVPKSSKDRCILPSESCPSLDLAHWPQGHGSRPLCSPALKGTSQLSLAVSLLFLDFGHVFCAHLGLEQAERKMLVFTFFSSPPPTFPLSLCLLRSLRSYCPWEAFLTHPSHQALPRLLSSLALAEASPLVFSPALSSPGSLSAQRPSDA